MTIAGDSGSGGGIWCAAANCFVVNCIVSSNTAYSFGGGGYRGTFRNSVVSGNNTVGFSGGGCYTSTLDNCAVVGNSDYGTIACFLTNCIVYFNSTNNSGGTLSYCCTTGLLLPPVATGSFTNPPQFVDLAAGNLRLAPNSPCINAGNPRHAPDGPDLDGNERIVGSFVDVGAYEFQQPASVISYAWLQQYNLPTDGSADYIDSDHDGMNNWQEWIAGTNPTNFASVLMLLVPTNSGPGLKVTWKSVPGKTYYLQRGANISMPFSLIQSNINGQANTTSYMDVNVPGSGPYFYRVGVQ